MNYKILAIVFIALFLVENIFFGWAYYSTYQQNKKTNICFYDICEQYPEATYDNEICTCYDYDVLGNFVQVKTKYLP